MGVFDKCTIPRDFQCITRRCAARYALKITRGLCICQYTQSTRCVLLQSFDLEATLNKTTFPNTPNARWGYGTQYPQRIDVFPNYKFNDPYKRKIEFRSTLGQKVA